MVLALLYVPNPYSIGAAVTRKELLNYHLPTLGHISCTFHAESADILRSLTQSKEINRLQETPQLGAVSAAWAGARHTRWDYIMLLVFLIQQCKERTNYRLNTAIEIADGTKVSSTLELLHCWSLLLQTGHLYWTFSSERILLDAVRRNTDLQTQFIESVPSAIGKEWVRAVLAHHDYHRSQHVLAYFRLERTVRDPDLRRLATKILDAYVTQSQQWNSKLTFTTALYRRLRRLAYLTLDAEYSPAVVSPRLDRILRDHAALERVLDPYGPDEDELSGLERYLAKHVYFGRAVLLETARKEYALEKRIEPALANGNLRYVVEELARQPMTLAANRDRRLIEVVRVELDSEIYSLVDPAIRRTNSQVRRANGWARRHGTSFRLSYESHPGGKLVVFQAHALNHALISQSAALSYAMRFINGLGQRLLQVFQDETRFLLQQRLVLGDVVEQLVLAVLRRVFSRDITWEWGDSIVENRVLWLPSLASHDVVDRLIRQAGLPEFRAHEIRSTINAVSGLRPGPLVVVLANLRAFDRGQKTPCAELDGIAITRNRRSNELIVTIIEAKEQRKSSERASIRALREKLVKLGLRANDRKPRIRSRINQKRAYAWRNIRLAYIDPSRVPQVEVPHDLDQEPAAEM